MFMFILSSTQIPGHFCGFNRSENQIRQLGTNKTGPVNDKDYHGLLLTDCRRLMDKQECILNKEYSGIMHETTTRGIIDNWNVYH